MGYMMLLTVSLIMLNVVLYIYGVDLPLSTWIECSGNTTECWGGQNVGTSTQSWEPTGTASGGLGSAELIKQLIYIIAGAIGLAVAISIGTGLLSTNYTSNFTIPLTMFMVIFITLIITPMGSVILGSADTTTGLYCYAMRSDAQSFGLSGDACLPWEAHLLMVIFFGLLTVGAFMSFVAGRDY